MKSSWVRAKAGVWVAAPQVGHHRMAGGRPTSSSVSPLVPDSLRVEGGPEGGRSPPTGLSLLAGVVLSVGGLCVVTHKVETPRPAVRME